MKSGPGIALARTMKYLMRFLLTGLVILLVYPAAFAVESRTGEVALPTELKVSGPSVFVRGPLGLRYRPGYSFPIELRVHNNGPEFNAEVTLGEGGPESAARSGLFEAINFPAQKSRVFSFPVRAPAVSANLTLQIREVDSSGGTGALRFQASLARVMKPLAPETPLILSVGAARSPAAAMLPDAVQMKAQELPDQPWQYDNVDVVVLSDGSLKDASAAARSSLRLWLLGGGRLFVASNEALAPAIAADLLPIEQSGSEKIGAELSWWEKHAKLNRANILIEKNNRPVYAFLNLGFGTVVFLFPGTSREEAAAEGARLINHPVLQSQREKFPDLRVQPDRYAAFASGSLSHDERRQLQLWLGLGALVFCIGLALGFTSRMRMLAVGWPLTIAILLTVMLARWYPARELSVSRIDWRRVPLDARSVSRVEWTLLESTYTPVGLNINGPENGSLLPIYAYADEIGQAAHNFQQAGPRLVMQESVVLPRQSSLFSAATVEVQTKTPVPVKYRAKNGTMTIDSPVLPEGNSAVLARSNGTLWVLSPIKAEEGFEMRKFDDWLTTLRSTAKSTDDRKLKAYATALAWATRDALRSKRDTLIVWKQMGRDESGGLIELDYPGAMSSDMFSMNSLQVVVSE
jgi:hypothetical protein